MLTGIVQQQRSHAERPNCAEPCQWVDASRCCSFGRRLVGSGCWLGSRRWLRVGRVDTGGGGLVGVGRWYRKLDDHVRELPYEGFVVGHHKQGGGALTHSEQ